MRNDSLTLKFYLYKQKESAGDTSAIYLRIMVNRKKAEISTKFIVKDQDWHKEMQRLHNKTPINSALAQMEGQIMDLYQEMKATRAVVTASSLKNKFLGRAEDDRTFAGYFESVFENTISKNQDLSLSTIKNYRSTLKHAKQFLQESKLKNIALTEFDVGIVRKWDTFLKNKDSANDPSKKLNQSTVTKYHVKLRAIFNMAVQI
jgi:hypothetical protein